MKQVIWVLVWVLIVISDCNAQRVDLITSNWKEVMGLFIAATKS